jgi:3-oxoadipate enol-lactonase
MPCVRRGDVASSYESFGEGAPVVLLHALSMNRYAWVHQVFALARTHRVLVVDLRGHGLSDRPAGGYSIPEMALDVRAVLDDASVEQVSVVGNSAGGMIAVQLALDAPERVERMVLVSCATGLSPLVPPAVLQAYEARFEAAFDAMTRGATSARTKRERPEVASFLADVWRARGNFSPLVFQSCVRDPGGVFGWDVTERLREIERPALVFAGQEDQAVPLDAVRALAEGLPRATLRIVPEVGHYYPMERPGDFNDELRAFLAPRGGRGP